jgi:molecular chaperone HscB
MISASHPPQPVRDVSCTSCGAKATETEVFCRKCDGVQIPSDASYFTLMEMEERFELNLERLEASYFALQRQLHPDRYRNRSEKERQLSLLYSMRVNEAYQTLKSPLLRAQYLLKRQGVDVTAEKHGVTPAPAVLMQVMEWREALAEMESPTDLQAFGRSMKEEFHRLLEEFHHRYEAGELAPAAQTAITLGYLEKILHEIKVKQHHLLQSL